MKFEDLKILFLDYKDKYGKDAYKKISQLLIEAKEIHKKDWEKNPTERGDHEQSWRAFKGKNLEKLIKYIIDREINEMGLRVVNGNKLERSKKLPAILSRVKRNLAINYGEFGLHLPDVDLVIFYPDSGDIVAVISSKVTLRERIAQTGYWKLKLINDKHTEHIKVFFITPDEDGTLTKSDPMPKGRAIVESDLDGSYVLTEAIIEQSERVKLFEHFITDLSKIISNKS